MTIHRIDPERAVTTDRPQTVGTGQGSVPVGTARRWLEFNIHDRAAMRVAEDAATASILRDMFAPFRTQGLEQHDMTMRTHLALDEREQGVDLFGLLAFP